MVEECHGIAIKIECLDFQTRNFMCDTGCFTLTKLHVRHWMLYFDVKPSSEQLEEAKCIEAYDM